jgi:preprotein translocase subunit YajC
MPLTFFLALASPPEGSSGGGGSALFSLLPFVFIFLIFYFLVIRPQQQRQKKHTQMLASLKKGDRVLTSGGLFATVLNVKEDRVVATIADGVKVEISKPSISGVVEKG